MRLIYQTEIIDLFYDTTEFHITFTIFKRIFNFNTEKQMVKPTGLNALFG